MNPIYCDRLQSPPASFSSLDDLNMTCGHSFGHLGTRASPAAISLDLVTTGFINGLLGSALQSRGDLEESERENE